MVALLALLVCVCANLFAAHPALCEQHDRRFGLRRGGEITYEPMGPGVLFDALDPAVKKWYVPQELFADYGWRQWEYSNYARQHYQRYVNTTIEGEPFYDLYGNYTTRGWLMFDWNQNRPGQFGSSIYKDPKFNNWFDALMVSSDAEGQFHYAITIGNRLRTTLTPMTFSKPRFNGMQIDVAADKYEGTVLFSRISEAIVGITPAREPSTTTNATNLMAGRVIAQVGDFVEVGATLVNGHVTHTLSDAFARSPFKGTLGVNQSATPVSGIAVILSDDSPEDGRGGAVLFSHDIRITSQDFDTGKKTEFTMGEVVSDPTAWPVLSGGFPGEGFVSADGDEKIVINFDFTGESYIGPQPSEIVAISFDLVVANDYRIEVWSDRQTGQQALPSLPLTGRDIEEQNPALFLIERAEGNVTDTSNQTRVVFDYGLPSANMIYGFTVEVKDLKGFDAFGEFDINRSYWQYPSPALAELDRDLQIHSREAGAWMLNASNIQHPYFFFGEAYSIDPGYSTATFLVDAVGGVVYDNPSRSLFEFVEDNDDQDRTPDWFRHNQGGPDVIVFPGWDENNDFVSDFNQNDNRTLSNRVPDYEEPFFRYRADRPEFLFGIDLNNNNWIDRFENDDEPDYPYKRDRRGYNLYGGAFLHPDVKLTVGRLRERRISSARENQVTYGLFSLDRDLRGLGRLRLFDMIKSAKDDIVDNRREMTPHLETNSLANVEDVLPARDTWVNSAYCQFDYEAIEKLIVVNKLKYDSYFQRGSAYRRGPGPVLRDRSHFFGVINKIDYRVPAADWVLHPKFKSEYLDQTAFVAGEEGRQSWTGTGILLLSRPVLRKTVLEAGVEFGVFKDLVLDEDKVLREGPAQSTGDFRNLVLAVQWSNVGQYLGYTLTTRLGFSYTKNWEEAIILGEDQLARDDRTRAFSTSFVTVYAGL